MARQDVWRRWVEVGLVMSLVLLALALRLYRLTAESLWFDEAYAVWSSAMDIASPRILWQWKIEFALYYLLLHFWMRFFGQGEFAVRSFAALAGTLAVVPMYALGKALFSRRVGALGALLLAVNPYHVWFSQEVRSYAPVVLAGLISLYAFWRLVHGGRWGWWLVHALTTGLAFHLHYYIVWIVLVQNAYFLGRLWLGAGGLAGRRASESRQGADGSGFLTATGGRGWWPAVWPWLLDQLGVLLLALPALAVFLTFYFGRNQWSWLAERYRPPALSSVTELLSAYSLGTLFLGSATLRHLALFSFVALAAWGALRGIWQARRADHSGEALALVLLALGLPLASIYLLGQVTTLWVTRYLLLFLPAYLLLVAFGVGQLTPRLGDGVAILLVAVSLFALSGMYGVQQKEDWRGVAAYISSRSGAQDLIVLLDEECRVPFNYYYGPGSSRVEVSRFADQAALDRAVIEIRARQRGGRLWLVVSHGDSAELERRLGELPGLGPPETREFVGVRLVSYVWG